MIIYRLAQAEGNEKSKDWVQLSLIIGNDSGGEIKQKVIRMPKLVFLQMAAAIEHNGLPYNKIEEIANESIYKSRTKEKDAVA